MLGGGHPKPDRVGDVPVHRQHLDQGTPVGVALLAVDGQADLQPVTDLGDPAQLAQWLAPSPGRRLSEHLYLVDPMGNWMMRFPAVTQPTPGGDSQPAEGVLKGIDTAAAAKIKRDVERVLRASASWDLPGRQP